MNAPLDWLLEGEAYIQYRARRDLLGQGEDDADVRTARAAMVDDPAVRGLVAELSGWPGKVIASHKSAGQPFHKLTFLAELGLRAADPGMGAVVEGILPSRSPERPFRLPINLPAEGAGSLEGDLEKWTWALCDSPLTLYALAKFGLEDHPVVRKAADYLTGLVRANGWPCAVSPGLNWRGPGRKADPCPFANLAMLKALSAFDAYRDSPDTRIGTETLLALWSASRSEHPYMFYMGTDFRKLKVPFVWYDLLHVLEVLTHFAWTRGDPRLGEMVQLLKDKADEQERYTLESAWTAWKEWEFGQKKVPSRWLTLAAQRIIARVEGVRV